MLVSREFIYLYLFHWRYDPQFSRLVGLKDGMILSCIWIEGLGWVSSKNGTKHMLSDCPVFSITPSVPKYQSSQHSNFVPKNMSFYSIQKVHVHARINQCQIWIINRGKHGHFTFLLICPRIPRMSCILGRREQSVGDQSYTHFQDTHSS